MEQNSSCTFPSRRPVFFRCESGVSDRHGRSVGAAQSFNFGVELLCKRVDDAGAKPGFWLGKDADRISNSIVSDRKLPIRSRNIKRNGDLPVFFIFAKRVLYRIDDELRDDQS